MNKASFVYVSIFLLYATFSFPMSKRLKKFTQKQNPNAPREIRYGSHAGKWFSDHWLSLQHTKEDLLYHMLVPMACDKFLIINGTTKQQRSNTYGIDDQFSLLARVERINPQTGNRIVEYRDCHLTFNESKVCYHRGAKIISTYEFLERLSEYDNPHERLSYSQLLNTHHLPLYMWVIQKNGEERMEYPFNLTMADRPYAEKVITGSIDETFHFSDGSSETVKIDFFSPLKNAEAHQ